MILNTDNKKESYRRTLRRIQRNNLYDIQNYIHNQNYDHTIERQKTKYMKDFLIDANIAFDEIHLSNDLMLDISIEPITHIMIPKGKLHVYGNLLIVQDIINKNCKIFPSVGYVFLINHQLKIYVIMMTR